MRHKSSTPGTPPSLTPSERLVRDIRRATRKQYSAEEKIRIVLDGLRGEVTIAELCRREGIAESLYYSWSKEFLEAGKRRLAGDTARLRLRLRQRVKRSRPAAIGNSYRATLLQRRRRNRTAPLHRLRLRRHCTGAASHTSHRGAATGVGVARSPLCHRQCGDVLGHSAHCRFLKQ